MQNMQNPQFNEDLSSSLPARPSKMSQERAGFFSFWYRWTAPPVPSENASFAVKETYRSGRLASIILLFVLVLGILEIPSILTNKSISPLAMISQPASLIIIVGALLCNRLGKRLLAGSLAVLGLSVGLAVSLVTTPGGLTLISILLLPLLVLPELLTVSLLPARLVFVDALCNILFIIVVLTFAPRSPAYVTLLGTYSTGVLIIEIVLQILVAVVTYLWVHSAIQAIQRADRAEEISMLVQREIARQEQEIRQKEELDAATRSLLQTHIEVANGNFQARVDLSKMHQLYEVASSLNMLIARLSSSYQSKDALEQTQAYVQYVLQAIHAAQRQKQPIILQRGSTILDELAIQLNGKYLISSPAPVQHVSRGESMEDEVRRQKFLR